jgi:glutamate-1-semialdehyde 2,1-aminomutase/spore coat polysaccharide biosynthesis protein SpsF
VNTLSKHPSRFVEGVFPKFVEACSGSRLRDVDDHTYIDWIGALGANLLGYDYFGEYDFGRVYSLPGYEEVLLAEKLVEVVPCAEMVRFGKNGVDATAAAVRLARAVTGRDMVVSYGYHGYQDLFGITGTMNDGIPAYNSFGIHTVFWNDINHLRETIETCVVINRPPACVIMEVPPERGEDVAAYLKAAIDLTHEYGALFILDEIVTGFRYALGGAHELYGVMPDIACVGKAMANGLPVSAVVGKREYMEHFSHVFFSTTFSGEISALGAALSTISVLQDEPVIEHIWKIGSQLRSGMQDLAITYGLRMEMPGNPPRSLINFLDKDGNESLLIKSLFLQECCKKGVLFGVPVFPTYSHTEKDVEQTLDAVETAFTVMKEAQGKETEFLEGKPMGAPYVRPKL